MKRLILKVNNLLIKTNYRTSKIEQRSYDLKNTWKVIKGANGKACKTVEIEKIDFESEEFTDGKQITELCNEHFVSIGNKHAKSIQPATVKFRL